MGLWFNPKTGEIRYIFSPYEALSLKREGWEKISSREGTRYYNFYSFYSKSNDRYMYTQVGKDSPLNYYIKKLKFRTYEEYCEWVSNMETIAQVCYKWGDRERAYEDREFLAKKTLKALRRRVRTKNFDWIESISWDSLLKLIPKGDTKAEIIRILSLVMI